MDIILTQKQEQILSAQMIQSLEVLQMTSQELSVYLENASLENPMLDIQKCYDDSDKAVDLYSKLKWLENVDPQNRAYYRQDFETGIDTLLQNVSGENYAENLYDYILAQLAELELSPDVAACTYILAGCLDASGQLDEQVAALAKDFGQSEKTMEQALAILQSLNPAGVAARSLSECLCLQLLRRTPINQLAIRIAQEQLDALSKNHYGLIARTLGTTQEKVRQACDLIRSLDPRPGLKFAQYERTTYITPDLIVTSISGRLELSVSRRFLPELNTSPYYARLIKETDDDQVKEYLTEKVKQAKWVVQAVEQRHETLMSCGNCILTAQEDFFRHRGALKPLTMADIAERMGVHESTVSRTINGKYLQCASGTYPLSYFFSRGLKVRGENTEVSPDAVKAALKELIAHEDKHKPLSDQKLCERMAQKGYILARRTVAKYRDELGIPGTVGRKQIL